ncbi:MAG: formate dehydrogenase accessory sulfurtransferase FdhD [Pseudomonadales bacterium]|nr:formate dehydrogenase accessory sulfurtransferase FdhD [Pseudomonadales bacterium]
MPIIAAISAPTSLALTFAGQNNQTLIGFLWGQQMNVYSHAKRVCMSD